MGIPRDHAQCLSSELGRGGAVVTVQAGSRNAAAEAVMQRNHGTIRYESQPRTEETSGTEKIRAIASLSSEKSIAYIPATSLQKISATAKRREGR